MLLTVCRWPGDACIEQLTQRIRSVNRVADVPPTPAYIEWYDGTRDESDVGTAGAALDAESPDGRAICPAGRRQAGDVGVLALETPAGDARAAAGEAAAGVTARLRGGRAGAR